MPSPASHDLPFDELLLADLSGRLAKLEATIDRLTPVTPPPFAAADTVVARKSETPVDLRWPARRARPPAPAVTDDATALPDFFAALPDPAVVIDSDGRVRLWPPAAAEFFGLSLADVIGESPAFVCPVNPTPYQRALVQARAGVRVRDVRLDVRTASGAAWPVVASAAPDGGGNVVFVFRPAKDAAPAPPPPPPAEPHALNELLTVIAGHADLLAEVLPAGDPVRGVADAIRTAARQAAGLTRRPPVADTSSPDAPLADGETVLLVDDDEAVREAAKEALERAGFGVMEAVAGDEAWRLARAVGGPIDLLVTDVVLPGLNGRKLADRLRAARPGLPVVYISGYPQPSDDLPPGTAFVPKPFRPRELLAAVRRVRRATVAV